MDQTPVDEPLTQNDLITEKENDKEGAEKAASVISRKESTLGKVKIEGLTPSPVPVKSENEEVDSMIGILKEKVTQNNSHS